MAKISSAQPIVVYNYTSTVSVVFEVVPGVKVLIIFTWGTVRAFFKDEEKQLICGLKCETRTENQ